MGEIKMADSRWQNIGARSAKINASEFKFYDNNVSLINKIMKFFLYYVNYSAVLDTSTQEFNLENSDILYFGALYIPIKSVYNNQSQQSYCDDRFHPSHFKRG